MDEIAMIMKQLFLKSNLLHIRTNEGEYEVSNPEVVHTSPLVQFHRKWNEGDEVEWPYGVELIVSTEGVSTKAVARLLPKEEKKDFETVLGDSIKAHDINNDLPGHLIEPDFLFPKHTVLGQGYHIKKDYNKLTESAYKEFEKLTPLHDMQVAMGQIVESSDPQENIFDLPKDVVFDLQRIALADDEMSAGFGAGVEYRLIARSILNKHRKPVSAPVESQEEMWNEVNEHINAQIGDYISLEAVKLSFILTRKPE